MNSHRLPNAQIQHDLLAPAWNRICPHISIQPFYLGALASTAITQTTEDLTRLSSTEFERGSRLGFQAGNRTTELEHGFDIAHLLALVDQRLEPGVGCFDLTSHVREFQTNDRVGDEFLAEGTAFVGVFDALFVADSGETDALDDYANAFVIEVGL